MAIFGECEVRVSVDASRVLDVIAAMGMMAGLLDRYGHTWTDEESAVMAKATASIECEKLQAETV